MRSQTKFEVKPSAAYFFFVLLYHIRCHVFQELAVEDMRHELDDEGRREFFEEQGGDGDGTSKGGGDRYYF